MDKTDNIVPALDAVKFNINKAAGEIANHINRDSNHINLIAVSKNFPISDIEIALNAGQRIFGENKIQEAAKKWPELRQKYNNIDLHLIGALQSNKIKQAVDIFDVIETIDRIKLARKLAAELKARDKAHNKDGDKKAKIIKCFIQINTGEEPQKAGIYPCDADEFIKTCIEELQLPIIGLMCIPPIEQEASLHFALLNKIATRNGLKELSMGMSNDYAKAIEFGATYVRVGSAIFGKRDYKIAT